MNDLHDLLHDAVADVEPADRLAELRARTASPQRAAARPWWWAAGATVLATAAAVAVVAVVSDGSDAPGRHHDGMAMEPPASTQLVAEYFIGDSPSGDRLYREFDRVPAGDPLNAALQRIQQSPADPDYTTPWAPGSFTSAAVDGDVIRVQIGDIDPSVSAGDLRVQQVVYTLQAAVGERLPVSFVDHGVDYIGRLGASPADTVLSPVSISDPAEGNEYAGSMIARGRAPLAGATWELLDVDRSVVRRGDIVTEESGSGLRPWTLTVDLDGVEPGTYTFVVTEGGRPGAFYVASTDTRTIIVR